MTTTTSTSTAISAPREKVWQLLTNEVWWRDADNGVASFDGTIVEGRRIRLVPQHDPRRARELRVTELRAPTSMLWTGGIPLGLCTGRRSFEVLGSGDRSSFSMVEDLTGPLSGWVIRVLADLQEWFDHFAAALKADSEA